MASTSLDLSQIRTDALSSGATFRTLIGLGSGDTPTFTSLTTSAHKITIGDMTVGRGGQTSVAGNVAIGYQALDSASLSGTNHIAIGYRSLNACLTGTGSVAIGRDSLKVTTFSQLCTAIGFQSFYNQSSAIGNTGLGALSGYSTTTGGYNTFIGINCAYSHATGGYNTAIGSNVALDSTTDSYQINIGNRYYHNRLRFGDTTPSYDVVLLRDAANTLALQNGANAQRFNLYGTYDSNGTNYRRLYLDSTTAGAFKIGAEGLGTGATGNTLELQTGGTSRLTIDASGNCGIGTTSPSQKLDVRGDLLVTTGTTTGVQLSRGIGTYAWQGPSMYLFSDPAIGLGTYGGLYWSGPNGGNADAFNFSNGLLLISNGSGGLSIATTLTNNPAPIRFFTGGYALSNERMRLNPIGNLGLGTTSPLSKLDIADTWDSNISVTGASGNGTTATLTFSAMTTAFPVGSTIVVSSVNPSGYNGTFTVTASTTTSVSYANTTTGAYVSGGNIKQLFTALKVNVTDTSSDAGSLLADLQVGGLSKTKIKKDGTIAFRGAGIADATIGPSGSYSLLVYGADLILAASYGFYIQGNPDFNGYISLGSGKAYLHGEATNVLAQRNSTNAQRFNLYGTYTDAANYRRLYIDSTTAGAFKIGIEGAGSGASGNTLTIPASLAVGGGSNSNFGTIKATSSQNGYLFCGYDAVAANQMFFVGNNDPSTATKQILFGISDGIDLSGPTSASYLWFYNNDFIIDSYSSNKLVSIYHGTKTTGSYTAKFGSGSIELLRNTSITGTLSVSGNVTVSAVNLVTDTTTGTKIGTATNQKLGFWNATPDVQPTTAVAAATLVGNGGNTITDTDTFDGYTLKQIVKALRNIGILA